ncbi:hypothetical protein NEAUS04_2307 [Nematocida ausubeli]|uniref:Uncharacterized protein n=1 Tax=Nematocida ausubeli (strain ATCC PRA-371 / ERTm2) TaxID=1913371 RepID=A0A086IZA3_NEMA1|nr:uncharacterized protein NESG_01990 [Nematocida ausubeli]KAI5138831.1 hypothetical protein NEAUS07_2499 [Nematocida ausubeli]KAI5151533.1 hypothetical protein NEAUS05_2528 [Nematocida ausubeli]KAI5164576.1 hypothetical protein NEAUS04_2307 [Nematocida ausubeli]KFG25221.1 hypothetical protein NESG_01990 [Nematocida ausubeli]
MHNSNRRYEYTSVSLNNSHSPAVSSKKTSKSGWKLDLKNRLSNNRWIILILLPLIVPICVLIAYIVFYKDEIILYHLKQTISLGLRHISSMSKKSLDVFIRRRKYN